jgi:hypothetical protein
MKSDGSPKGTKDKNLNKENEKLAADNNVGKTNKNKSNLNKKIIEQQQKMINMENEKHDSAPQNNYLVKYDTPFLVSTTISNKKTLEELDDNNENAEIFLRNLINKRGTDVSYI